MKRPAATLTENPFNFDELFFSVTDKRGVILFGNEVFTRISKYPQEKLIGAPHSLIRHPDMPRSVFKLFWDTLHTDSPIIAYVKNLAADGSFYWVMAFAFPVEEGYLSIRIKPSSPLLAAVKNIYAATLQVEAEGGMEKSGAFLMGELKKAGFNSYTEFMLHAAFTELSILQEHSKKNSSEKVTSSANSLAEISGKAALELQDCFQRIQSFQEANQYFSKTMSSLNDGFRNLKYIALNMTIAAAKFGSGVASLGVVSKEFSSLSETIQTHISGLGEFISTLSEVVQKCALRIVSLQTQMLMVEFFVRESLHNIESENAFAGLVENRKHFSALFKTYSAGLEKEISVLDVDLNSISLQMQDIKKFTTGLEVIRQIGAVESSRDNQLKQTFVHYLDEMRRFIDLLQGATAGLHENVLKMQESSVLVQSKASHIAGDVDAIFDLAAEMTAKQQAQPA